MTTIRSQFNSHFSEDSLKKIFNSHIIYSGATGIDNMNQYSFRQQLDEQIAIVSRKVIAGDYKFSKYKLKLISKGRNKVPRELSIPTIRDRLALRALCNFLQERFDKSINFQLPQEVIGDIKNVLNENKYDGYIKLDVVNFYPSINHCQLKKQLDKRLRMHSGIMNIIFSAIQSPTVLSSKKLDKQSKIGVPQGLSISNILAAVFLQDIDKYLLQIQTAKCYRYVDDILILCNLSDSGQISKDIIKRCKNVGLEIHSPIEMPHKSKIDSLSNGFDYLGYTFEDNIIPIKDGSLERFIISVRDGSIERLKSSLVGIFTSYKYSKTKNIKFLEWRINLRITGCVFENKSKGWLFFFSKINNDALCHCLDHYVKSLCRRFSVDIKAKKFVRSFKELSHRRFCTTYIPNFDTYNLEKMKQVLVGYFDYKIDKMTDLQVEQAFKKKVSNQIKDLEADIKDFSSSG